MTNGIRTGDPRGFNKGRSSKLHEGSRVRQTPEKSRRTYRPKRCGNNNKDEHNSLKTLNDKKKTKQNKKKNTNTKWIDIFLPIFLFGFLSCFCPDKFESIQFNY